MTLKHFVNSCENAGHTFTYGILSVELMAIYSLIQIFKLITKLKYTS